jgi:Esterase/lipase
VRRRLRSVRTPCLVVHSSHDDIASLRNVALIERNVAGPVETVLLDDSYHMVSVDQQRDVVVASSVDFFSRVVAEKARGATSAVAHGQTLSCSTR